MEDEEDITQIDTLFTNEIPQETPDSTKLASHEKERNHFAGFKGVLYYLQNVI